MKIQNVRSGTGEAVAAKRIKMRCPICLKEGTLDQRGADLQVTIRNQSWSGSQPVTGERICPNPDCAALIYLIYTYNSAELLSSYPAERIDFDASLLPELVQEPLEEAIECHAQECYPASAVMVRRTLEMVCEDQGATGDNLYKRIESLGKTIVMPKGMVDALHNLRLLGNDAVHVEAQVYAEVGQRKVEVAINVVKTILQATYQMDSLLSELENLKSDQAQ
jgi:Domain of unknown function (DUF4145)